MYDDGYTRRPFDGFGGEGRDSSAGKLNAARLCEASSNTKASWTTGSVVAAPEGCAGDAASGGDATGHPVGRCCLSGGGRGLGGGGGAARRTGGTGTGDTGAATKRSGSGGGAAAPKRGGIGGGAAGPTACGGGAAKPLRSSLTDPPNLRSCGNPPENMPAGGGQPGMWCSCSPPPPLDRVGGSPAPPLITGALRSLVTAFFSARFFWISASIELSICFSRRKDRSRIPTNGRPRFRGSLRKRL